MVYFQKGVESVGRVTVRNLRRVDATGFKNGNFTVRIEPGVKIERLLLDNVEQVVADDRPLVSRDPQSDIVEFIQK